MTTTELRRHQASGLRAGDAQCVHGLVGVELEAARRTGGGRKDAERGAGVPAGPDVSGAHAQPYPGSDLLARHGRRE